MSNKLIARNTILLYIRMLLTMGISLYTSRLILKYLGVEDYGIYNIVGGVIMLLSFLNSAMATATQRYMTFAIGEANSEELKKIFNVSIFAHITIVLLVVFFSETIGLWFLNTYIDLPSDKIVAANWVYQFSILAFCFQIIGVPYNASIIAHEEMNIYAYVSIVEVVLKLLVVWVLQLLIHDRLVVYSVLIFLTSVVIFQSYRLLCKKKYSCCRFLFIWDRSLYKELMSFSGWSFLGQIALISSTQGGNILLNMFYGVTVNAAMGIANQVSAAMMNFVSNFQTAFKPQITKLYAQNEKQRLYTLTFNASKYSFYLMYILSLPIMLNINSILNWWLTEVPEYTASFGVLMIIHSLLDALMGPLWMIIFATGYIKRYQLLLCLVVSSNIWLSYIFLRQGYSPEIILIIRIIVNFVILLLRLGYTKHLSGLSISRFLNKVILPICLVLLVTIPVSLWVSSLLKNYFFILPVIIIIFINCIIIFFLGISRVQQKKLYSLLQAGIKKCI